MTNIGDGISSVNRGRINLFGGGTFYNQIRASARSFVTREMIDEKIGKKSLRRLRKSIKHITSFSEEKISRLYARYEKKPRALEKHLTKLVKIYSKYMDIFVTEYDTLLKVLNDELLNLIRESSSQEKFLIDILEKIKEVNKVHNNLLPTASIDRLENEIKDFLYQSKKDVNKEFREDNREEEGYHIHKNLWARVWGVGAVNHQVRKLAGKWKRKQFRDLRKNVELIDEAIRTGQIDVAILSRIEKHVKNMEKSEEIYKKMAHDVKLVIQTVSEDVMKGMNSMNIIIAMTKGRENSGQIRHVVEEYEKLKVEHKELIDLLRSDETNLRKLSFQINTTRQQLSNAFNGLRLQNNWIRKKIQEDPVSFARGDVSGSEKLAA